jgi:hypothetical protein
LCCLVYSVFCAFISCFCCCVVSAGVSSQLISIYLIRLFRVIVVLHIHGFVFSLGLTREFISVPCVSVFAM